MTLARMSFLLLSFVLSVPAHAATVQIAIDKLTMAFTPADASAKVGDTVEWVNKDVLAHSATAKTGDNWDVLLGVGKSGRVVLKKAGTIDYYCKFHPDMKGSITVSP